MISSDRHRVDIDRYRDTALVAISFPITCGEFLHLSPVPSSTPTAIAVVVIGLSCWGVVNRSPHHHCAGVYCYRRTEIVNSRRITRGEFLHLSPVLSSTLIAPEDIGRASVGVFKPSSDHYCVDIDRYRPTELVIHCRITGREFLSLSPKFITPLMVI